MKGLNVLSYCDGMSCGQIALNELGFEIENYYASEIKDTAIKATKKNFPNTKYIGDLTKLSDEDIISLGEIDLFISGTPCKNLSGANKERLGLKGEQSKLFYDFAHALSVVKPKYFFFENVRMSKEDEDIITSILGVNPVKVNSKIKVAALRERLYWTNIPFKGDLSDTGIKLQEVLERGWTDREKARCLLESDSRPLLTPVKMFHRHYSTGFTTAIFLSEEHYKDCVNHYEKNFKGLSASEIFYEGDVYDGIRYLTTQEREILQGVPVGYTSILTPNESAGLLGDGWTIGIVKEFFKGMR